MVLVQALANTILQRSFEERIRITPMKLQKLLYFICADYMKKNNKPLISENFEVWKYGPVLSSIYYEFQSYGAKPITQFAKDAQGNVYIVNQENDKILSSINSIWNTYKDYTGIELSKMTHKENSAWYKAYISNEPYLRDEDIKNEEF